MPTYKVTWTIDIDADTPEEAAARALIIQKDTDPANAATIFDVDSRYIDLSLPAAVFDLDAEYNHEITRLMDTGKTEAVAMDEAADAVERCKQERWEEFMDDFQTLMDTLNPENLPWVPDDNAIYGGSFDAATSRGLLEGLMGRTIGLEHILYVYNRGSYLELVMNEETHYRVYLK